MEYILTFESAPPVAKQELPPAMVAEDADEGVVSRG